MDIFTLLLIIIFLISLSFLFRKNKFTRQQIDMIDAFPGPKRYPIVGTAGPFLFIKREYVFDYFRKLSETYRPVFRCWFGSRPVIFISDPRYIEMILSNTVHMEKAYSFVELWLGEGLITSSGAKWFRDRKLLTPAFHFKILEVFTEVFVEKSEKLIELLSEKVGGQPFDIFSYITRCTLDVLSKTAMGIEINSLTDETNEYATAIAGIAHSIMYRTLRPWLGRDFIFYRTRQGKEFQKHLSVLLDTANNVIDEKQSALRGNSPKTDPEVDDVGRKRRKAFLDLLLEISEDGALSKKDLCDQVNTFMFAGHDTTAAALCWVLFLLATHPEIQEKCYEEISDVLPPGETLTFGKLSEFKYLERVIKESLRMFPSVGTITRKASEDIKIENNTIPKGCTISIQIYELHNNPKYFPEPRRFDPDRFLPENTKDRNPYAYIPFSAGPRNCIGQRFALAEEKTVLVHVLRNFKVKTTQTTQDIDPMLEIILRPAKGFFVTLEKR